MRQAVHARLLAAPLADAGAKVVVGHQAFGEMALHFLEKYGMMAIKVPSKFDLRRFCRATGEPHSLAAPCAHAQRRPVCAQEHGSAARRARCACLGHGAQSKPDCAVHSCSRSRPAPRGRSVWQGRHAGEGAI